MAWALLLAEAAALIVLSTPVAADGEANTGHLRFNPTATLDVSQVEYRVCPVCASGRMG